MTPMHRGSSQPRLGDFNQRVVLDCIRRSRDGISRVEIAHHTGLSEQSVSTFTRRLLDVELVREAGRRVAGRGKPRTLLEPNPHGLYAVGVHLDPLRANICLLDFAGRVVDRREVWIEQGDAADLVLDKISVEIDALIETAGVSRERVVGVGVGAPGPIDWTSGTLINPPLLPQWHRVSLADGLGRRLALPVLIEKDVIVAAAGEAWLGHGDSPSTFLFLYLGAGLGVGFVNRGEVQRGVSHNFGEVGHVVVADDGPPLACCGRVGTLGARTSLTYLARRAVACGAASDDGSMRSHDRAVAALARACAEGHSGAAAEIDALAHDLATGVGLFTDLLDIDAVVIGGHTWETCGEPTLPRVIEHLGGGPVLAAARPLVVRSTRSPRDVVPIGAASLVLDDLLSPRPATLVHATAVVDPA